MPSVSYVLSAGGVLSSVNNGVSTPILSNVQSFAVDSSSDVFALQTTGSLLGKSLAASDFYSLRNSVDAFGLDLAGGEVVALSSGAVVESTISAALANGSWSDQSLGYDGGMAADHSIWFLEQTNSDPNVNQAIYRLNAGQLTQMTGSASSLAVLEGSVYALDSTQLSVSLWTGSTWSVQPSARMNNYDPFFFGHTNVDGHGDHTLYQWMFSPRGYPSAVTGVVGVSLGGGGYVGYVQDASGQAWGADYNSDRTWRKLSTVTAPDGSKFFFGVGWGNLGPSQGIGHDVGRWANGTYTAAPFTASGLGVAGGTLWALASGDQVWAWNGSAWVQQTSVTAADGSIWFLGLTKLDTGGDRSIFYFAFNQVRQAPGMAKSLSVSGGTVTATSAAGAVQHWSASPYAPPTVSAADGSLLALVNGELWRQSQAGAAWQVFFSVYLAQERSVIAFQLDAAGTSVYWLTADGTVRLAPLSNPTNWTLPGNSGIVAPDGSLWYIGSGMSIYHIQNGQAVQVSVTGSAYSLAVAEKTLFAYTTDSGGHVTTMSWNGTAFVPQPSGGVYFLGVANADGHGNHTVYQWVDGALTALAGRGVAMINYIDLFVRDTSGVVWQDHQGAWSKITSLTMPDGSVYLLALPRDQFGDWQFMQWANGAINQAPNAAAIATAEGAIWALSSGIITWHGTTWAVQPSATAPDGSVWFAGNATVDAQGDHALYRFAGGKLTRMPAQGVVIFANSIELVMIDAANHGWSWNATLGVWQAMTSVSAADGSFWYLGRATNQYHEHAVYRYSAGAVQDMSRAARLTLVNGLAWQDGYAGAVLQWSGTTSTTLTSARAADGSDWVLGSDTNASGNHTIYRWAPGGQPVVMPGAGVGLLASGTSMWMVTASGLASKWNGKAWIVQSANVQRLAAATGGLVYSLEADGSVMRLDGVKWTTVATSTITDSTGAIWFLNKTATDGKGNYAVERWANNFVSGVWYASDLILAGGSAWIVNPNGELFHWAVDYPRFGWYGPGILPDGGKKAQWVVGPEGVLYVRTTLGNLYQPYDTGTQTGFYDLGGNGIRTAIDSKGELILTDHTGWSYLIGGKDGIWISGGTVGNVDRFTVDASGVLFELASNGDLFATPYYLATRQRVAQNVTQIGVNADGELVALFGPYTFEVYDDSLGAFGIGGSGNIPMAIDAQERFFNLQGSTLYMTDASGTKVFATGIAQLATDSQDNVYVLQKNGNFAEVSGNGLTLIGTGGVAGPAGSGLIWYLGSVDAFGKRNVIQFSSTGQVTTLTRLPALIAAKWLAMGGPSGVLGSPNGNSGSHNGTLWQEFDAGAIYANSTRAFGLYGNAWWRYQANNQSAGFLGLPTSDYLQGSNFGWQTFTGGIILSSFYTSGHAITGDLWSKFHEIGLLNLTPSQLKTTMDADIIAAAVARLGLPTGEAQQATDINGTAVGQVQYFQNGALFYANSTQLVTYVSKHIADMYLAYQNGSRALGVALLDTNGADGALEKANFTNGVIYWSPTTNGRVLADAGTLNKLNQPLDTTTQGGAYLTDAWPDVTGALNKALTQHYGVHASAVGDFSLNLIEATAEANLQFMGGNYNTNDLADWMNGTPVLPNLDVMEMLTSLSHADDQSSYPAARTTAYSGNDQNAATVYFSSQAFVDWASPQTFARLLAEYYDPYTTDAAENEVETHLEAEGEAILAWAIRGFGNQTQAVQALANAIANGKLQITPVTVNYTYTVLGQQVTEGHLGFTITIDDPALANSLAPQPDLLNASGSTTIPGNSNTDGTVIKLGQSLLNQVLGTHLDISKFAFQGTRLAQAAKAVVYNQFFQKLGLSEGVLDQAWKLQNDPVLDLMNLKMPPDDHIWDGPSRLEVTINAGLHKVNSNLNFKITKLTFNTSTYELHAEFELHYDHNWGTLAQIGNNVINTVHNWAQTAGKNTQNWFNKEAGVLAQDWHNLNDAIGGALGPLDPLHVSSPWDAAAISALPQVLQALGEQGSDVATAVTNVVSNVEDQLEGSKIGKSLGDLAAGKPPLGLVDDNTFIDVNQL